MNTVEVEASALKKSIDGWDRNAVSGFLLKCKESAQRKGCFQVGSIALATQLKDPLAILKRMHRDGDPYFYFEHPVTGEATAGGEALFYQRLEGSDRFAAVRRFTQSIADKALVMDEDQLPFSGVRFFCGFSFFDAVRPEVGFPSAAIFVPRWSVIRRGTDAGIILNVRVEPQSELSVLENEISTCFQKLSVSEGVEELERPVERRTEGLKVTEVGDKDGFEMSVQEALNQIERGYYKKIVLARAVDLENQEQSFNAFYSLNHLRKKFLNCFSFALNLGESQSFIGATPESLIQLKGSKMETSAVAGSAPRGKNEQEDVRLSEALLSSEKNLLEHQVVMESICGRLQSLGIEPDVSLRPGLLHLPNVQHLQSSISAYLPRSIHLMDVVEKLHPTPAVGGTPRREAQSDIRRLESFDRGLYAGTIGWFDHRGDGEMVVAIRSALICGQRARIYAGAGIIKGSDPAQEREETDLKLQAMLEAIF